jgi:pSer/pThr/pTyr-binding forkhead associated (FHA) protein
VPAAGSVNCPQCNTLLTPGAAFCDNCGAPISAAPVYQPPAPQPTPQPGYGQPSPAYGQQPPAYDQQLPAQPQPAYGQSSVGQAPRLIVQATNAQIMLPPGKLEIIIGREDPVSSIYPDVDMTPHGGDDGGVSRRHARLFFQNGQWFVEDFQSTNFTHVNNQRVQPGTPMLVPNGAEIRVGRVKLTFYVQ